MTIKIVIFGLVVLLIGFLGAQDHSDSEAYIDHYCDMVINGHWPNYNDINCTGRRESE